MNRKSPFLAVLAAKSLIIAYRSDEISAPLSIDDFEARNWARHIAHSPENTRSLAGCRQTRKLLSVSGLEHVFAKLMGAVDFNVEAEVSLSHKRQLAECWIIRDKNLVWPPSISKHDAAACFFEFYISRQEKKLRRNNLRSQFHCRQASLGTKQNSWDAQKIQIYGTIESHGETSFRGLIRSLRMMRERHVAQSSSNDSTFHFEWHRVSRQNGQPGGDVFRWNLMALWLSKILVMWHTKTAFNLSHLELFVQWTNKQRCRVADARRFLVEDHVMTRCEVWKVFFFVHSNINIWRRSISLRNEQRHKSPAEERNIGR